MPGFRDFRGRLIGDGRKRPKLALFELGLFVEARRPHDFTVIGLEINNLGFALLTFDTFIKPIEGINAVLFAKDGLPSSGFNEPVFAGIEEIVLKRA